MSNQTNQPNPGQSRELNLQKTAEQFMAALQRHFDMLAYNLASRENVAEEAYVARVNAPRAMPASQVHSNFEQMQAYARDLLLGQVVNDSLNLAVSALNNAHLFLALIKANQQQGNLSPEVQKACQQAQQEFVKLPLDQKFNRLEQEYGVMCELEDSMISLGFVIQALMQQGGIVKEPQVDSDKELKLEMKAAKAGEETIDVWRKAGELETIQKVFPEGEKINFSDTELQSILLTIAVFTHQLFKTVSGYARDSKQGA